MESKFTHEFHGYQTARQVVMTPELPWSCCLGIRGLNGSRSCLVSIFRTTIANFLSVLKLLHTAPSMHREQMWTTGISDLHKSAVCVPFRSHFKTASMSLSVLRFLKSHIIPTEQENWVSFFSINEGLWSWLPMPRAFPAILIGHSRQTWLRSTMLAVNPKYLRRIILIICLQIHFLYEAEAVLQLR